MTDRLSMYFLCGNTNKIYLDALWRRHSALLPPIAENPCECKIPAEYTCPETFRYPTPTPNPRGKPYPIRKSRQAGTGNCQFEQTRSGNCVPCGGKIES